VHNAAQRGRGRIARTEVSEEAKKKDLAREESQDIRGQGARSKESEGLAEGECHNWRVQERGGKSEAVRLIFSTRVFTKPAPGRGQWEAN